LVFTFFLFPFRTYFSNSSKFQFQVNFKLK
jgi:hypothetical protein